MRSNPVLRTLFAAVILAVSAAAVSAQSTQVNGKVTMKQADGTVVPVADAQIDIYRTDIKAEWFSERPVLWHHGADPVLRDTVIGKAVNLREDEDGWWVDVWLKAGEKRLALIRRLAERGQIYGSSGTIGYLKKAAASGEILVWPYVEQTLTTSPQNTYSTLRAAKAVLEHFDLADIEVNHEALKAWLADVDALSTDLRASSSAGGRAAMAGRVSAADVRQLRDALRQLDETFAELE